MDTMDNHQHAWLSEVLPSAARRVLDAGCGRGDLAAELVRRGHEVTAIDISTEAVEAARAAGVPALRADITTYPVPGDGLGDDVGSLFDAVVMSLSLHHMHPLDAALDRVSALLKKGGLVIVDEFAWDWADRAAAAWFYDAGSLLAAAGVADFPREPGSPGRDPVERWREAHLDHTPAADMLAALAQRLEITSLRREPYLSRYIGGYVSRKVMNSTAEVINELWRIERARISAGTLPLTGFRLTARKM
ncbi:class I SAM-dependent methyltransferase [Nonomuraea sp. SYSU D8015]|uniref:class I SAM-dependent methyltransferase n=1 Tax=Nonomuraea sp. SYSU D8015 TaxID=2593644 RepID=UPI001660BF21|nr:class I SAM-dependent methyltransferase [Nonomuraea sp. SYSU D8015]